MSNSFTSTIGSLPCQVHITHYYHKPPDPSCTDSDVDFHGYTDVDYEIKDIHSWPKDGTNAWLESKAHGHDEDRLRDEIINYMEKQDEY